MGSGSSNNFVEHSIRALGPYELIFVLDPSLTYGYDKRETIIDICYKQNRRKETRPDDGPKDDGYV
jgi:hypothetical protein